MTKEEVENVIKRFPYITEAIRHKAEEAVFYIGNRKFTIGITDEIKTVCDLVDVIFKNEKNSSIKKMIRLIIAGKSDVYIVMNTPYSRSAYYVRKHAFISKIYQCCIARGLVPFENVINEEIA